MTLTVELDDGTIHERCDTTSNPFGQKERVCSVWVGDEVKVYPMERVKCITLHWD
jgi:hypothetical protein